MLGDGSESMFGCVQMRLKATPTMHISIAEPRTLTSILTERVHNSTAITNLLRIMVTSKTTFFNYTLYSLPDAASSCASRDFYDTTPILL